MMLLSRTVSLSDRFRQPPRIVGSDVQSARGTLNVGDLGTIGLSKHCCQSKTRGNESALIFLPCIDKATDSML